MENKIKIAVVGGDTRSIYAAEELSRSGFEISICGFADKVGISDNLHIIERPEEITDAVLFPIPYSRDGIYINTPFSESKIFVDEIMESISKNCKIIGGCFDNKFIEKYVSQGYKIYDCYDSEELKILNAIPTAEGALAIAMQETSKTVHGSFCTVISYGNVGEALAILLYKIGAKVTVVARRNSSRAKAVSACLDTVSFDRLPMILEKSDIVFNAAPAKLITEDMLSHTKKDVLIIDLASKPGGVDFDAAKKLGRKAIWALSLPGKVAPKTAGKYLAQTVENIIKGDI